MNSTFTRRCGVSDLRRFSFAALCRRSEAIGRGAFATAARIVRRIHTRVSAWEYLSAAFAARSGRCGGIDTLRWSVANPAAIADVAPCVSRPAVPAAGVEFFAVAVGPATSACVRWPTGRDPSIPRHGVVARAVFDARISCTLVPGVVRSDACVAPLPGSVRCDT